MGKTIILILFSAIVNFLYVAQQETETRSMEVYSITEFIDGYLIKAIDRTKNDTLRIISGKQVNFDHRHYKRIIVGKSYQFEFRDVLRNSAPIPPDHVLIKIKSTVVWTAKDGYNNIPVFSTNTRGLWIKIR